MLVHSLQIQHWGVVEEESNIFLHSTKWSEFLAEGRLVLYLACRIISIRMYLCCASPSRF